MGKFRRKIGRREMKWEEKERKAEKDRSEIRRSKKVRRRKRKR